MICASLPVVAPQLLREYKNKHSSQRTDNSSHSRSMVKGFQRLVEGSGDQTTESRILAGEEEWACGSIPLNTVVTENPPQTEDPGDAQIVVKKEYEVTVGGSDGHAVMLCEK